VSYHEQIGRNAVNGMGETDVRRSPLDNIHDAAKELSALESRTVKLAERLVGSWPEPTIQPGDKRETIGEPPLIDALGNAGRNMCYVVGRINNALNAIEAKLP